MLEGDLTGGDGPAALFIDRFGGGFGGFHAGGFHAGGMGGFHAVASAPGASAAALIVRGLSVSAASALSASGIIPTSLAAPGIGEDTVLQRLVPPRWGGCAGCGGSKCRLSVLRLLSLPALLLRLHQPCMQPALGPAPSTSSNWLRHGLI